MRANGVSTQLSVVVLGVHLRCLGFAALGAYPNPDPWLGVFPIERERPVFQVLFAQELRIDIDLE
jgi:hypothetical protein